MILPETKTYFPPARAEELARDLQAADEDGWTFTTVRASEESEFSFVEVRDEDADLVGRL